MEAVTAVLVDRAREPRGLSRMLAGSLALHALVVAAVVFGPAPVAAGDRVGGAEGRDERESRRRRARARTSAGRTRSAAGRCSRWRPAPAGEAGAGAAAGREDAGDDAAGARGREEAAREAGEGRTAAARGEVGARRGERADADHGPGGEVRLEFRRDRGERARAGAGDGRRGHGIVARRRGFLLPRLPRDHGAADQGELELQPGRVGHHGDAVHDPAGRPDHRHRRRTVSGLRARPHGAAGAAAAAGSCRRCRRRTRSRL